MSNLNTVTLSGRLTKDPELRHTGSGTSVAQLRLAVNRSRKDGDDWVEETSFFDIVAWSNLGERVSNKLTKGDRIHLTGRLNQREWETDDGQKRSAVEVIAERIEAEGFFREGSKDGAAPAADELAGVAAGQGAADDDIPF